MTLLVRGHLLCLGIHLQQQRVLMKFHLVVVALVHQQKHRDSNQVSMVVTRRDRARVSNVPQILLLLMMMMEWQMKLLLVKGRGRKSAHQRCGTILPRKSW